MTADVGAATKAKGKGRPPAFPRQSQEPAEENMEAAPAEI